MRTPVAVLLLSLLLSVSTAAVSIVDFEDVLPGSYGPVLGGGSPPDVVSGPLAFWTNGAGAVPVVIVSGIGGNVLSVAGAPAVPGRAAATLNFNLVRPLLRAPEQFYQSLLSVDVQLLGGGSWTLDGIPLTSGTNSFGGISNFGGPLVIRGTSGSLLLDNIVIDINRSIPEPTSALVFGLGALLAGAGVRRR